MYRMNDAIASTTAVTNTIMKKLVPLNEARDGAPATKVLLFAPRQSYLITTLANLISQNIPQYTIHASRCTDGLILCLTTTALTDVEAQLLSTPSWRKDILQNCTKDYTALFPISMNAELHEILTKLIETSRPNGTGMIMQILTEIERWSSAPQRSVESLYAALRRLGHHDDQHLSKNADTEKNASGTTQSDELVSALSKLERYGREYGSSFCVFLFDRENAPLAAYVALLLVQHMKGIVMASENEYVGIGVTREPLTDQEFTALYQAIGDPEATMYNEVYYCNPHSVLTLTDAVKNEIEQQFKDTYPSSVFDFMVHIENITIRQQSTIATGLAVRKVADVILASQQIGTANTDMQSIPADTLEKLQRSFDMVIRAHAPELYTPELLKSLTIPSVDK